MQDADQDWRQLAECRDADPDLFTPDHPTLHVLNAAVAYCNSGEQGCPARADCKAYADAMADPYGVWAGEWRGPWSPPSVADLLDEGEWQELMREGLTDGQIAKRLGLSRDQVRYHRAQQSA